MAYQPGLFSAKTILAEEQSWYYLTYSWGNKGVRTFPEGISTKVNVIARLEFEFTYFEVATQHFTHYAMETFPDGRFKIEEFFYIG